MWYQVVSATVVKTESHGTAILPCVIGVSVSVMRVYNPGWQPVKTDLDSYECRHGIGYSRFTSSKNGIKSSLLTSSTVNLVNSDVIDTSSLNVISVCQFI